MINSIKTDTFLLLIKDTKSTYQFNKFSIFILLRPLLLLLFSLLLCSEYCCDCCSHSCWYNRCCCSSRNFWRFGHITEETITKASSSLIDTFIETILPRKYKAIEKFVLMVPIPKWNKIHLVDPLLTISIKFRCRRVRFLIYKYKKD